MSKVYFKRNPEAIRELMSSEEMKRVLIEKANEVKNRCGEDYSVHVGKSRASVSVLTTSNKSYQDNVENNTLLKGLK